MLAAITSEMADIVRPRAWNASRRQFENRSLSLRGTKGSNPYPSNSESVFALNPRAAGEEPRCFAAVCSCIGSRERPGRLRAREPANLQQQRSMLVSLKSPKLKTIAKLEGERMEWEEALLGSWGAEIPAHPPAYYRRKAARARQFAEEATTQAVKARLLAEAVHCDQLAADAEHLADEYLGFREGDILPGLNHHGST